MTEAQQAQASEGTLTFSPSATQTAREVRAIIEGRWMGASLQTIPLVYASDRPAPTDTPGVTARAATILRPGVECRIVIYPRAAQDRGIDLQFTIAHEVMHCYQRELLGATAYNALPDWRAEGTADWAAFDVTGIDHDTKGGLVSYALMPRTSLFRRSYDASGFFGHLQEQAVNVWSTLTRTLLAADDPAAYADAGANEAFLDTWGSSMYRHGAFGPERTFTKPVPVPESLPTPVTPIVNRGTAATEAYSTAHYTVQALGDAPSSTSRSGVTHASPTGRSTPPPLTTPGSARNESASVRPVRRGARPRRRSSPRSRGWRCRGTHVAAPVGR